MSKAMSYLLRHGAIKEGVRISSSGRIHLNDLEQWLKSKGIDANIMDIVANDAKGRFSFDPTTLEVWATQGHSMEIITDDMVPWTSNNALIHVSYMSNYEGIMKDGLQRMARQHVHMIDTCIPGSWDLLRKDTDLYVVVYPSCNLFKSENNVILSPGPEKQLVCIPAPSRAGCYGFIISSTDDNRKFLLVKTKANQYGFPKGKVHKGEHKLQCALRELYEETGLSFADIKINTQTLSEVNEKNITVTSYFTATTNVMEPCPKGPGTDKEGLTTCWLSMSEIRALPEQEFRLRRRMLLDAVCS